MQIKQPSSKLLAMLSSHSSACLSLSLAWQQGSTAHQNPAQPVMPRLPPHSANHAVCIPPTTPCRFRQSLHSACACTCPSYVQGVYLSTYEDKPVGTALPGMHTAYGTAGTFYTQYSSTCQQMTTPSALPSGIITCVELHQCVHTDATAYCSAWQCQGSYPTAADNAHAIDLDNKVQPWRNCMRRLCTRKTGICVNRRPATSAK
jgi:hypothetical protein